MFVLALKHMREHAHALLHIHVYVFVHVYTLIDGTRPVTGGCAGHTQHM